jgi:HK97 family phage prohead protease
VLDQEYSLPLPILEVKAAPGAAGEPEERTAQGYVAAFSNVDHGNDVILPGAFDATLATGRKVRFLREHDRSRVLGVTLALKADAHGLLGRFRFSRTPLGEETYQLLRDGALDSFSIGYRADDFGHRADGVRELKAISLYEASVVSLAMNERALVTTVKGAPELPFDALWQQLTDAFLTLTAGLEEAKALQARRAADRPPRALTPRHVQHLSRTLEAAEATLTELRSLAQASPPPPEAKAAAADGVRLRLELARRRLQRAGVLSRVERSA